MLITDQYIEALSSLEKKYGKLSAPAQADTIKRLTRLAPSFKEIEQYINACSVAGKILTGLEVDMALMEEGGPATPVISSEPENNSEDLVEDSPLVNSELEDEWPF
jgi:hypothetical protein